MGSYTEDVHGLHEELSQVGAQPLVPGAVPVHVLSRGRDVKVPCKGHAKEIF